MISRKNFAAAGLILCFVASPTFASETADLTQRASLQEAGKVSIRQNGEVEVRLQRLIQGRNGAYQVSLTFKSQEDLDRAFAEGLTTVRLDDLESFVSMDESGKPVGEQARGISLLEVAETAGGALCGDVVARGQKLLAEGLPVGVSVHAAQERGAALKRVDVWPTEDVRRDVFGACAFYDSEDGCGGGTCVNVRNVYGTNRIISGSCTLFGGSFSTCWCQDRYDS